jgi:flagellar L-ring protein precursor FlgH
MIPTLCIVIARSRGLRGNPGRLGKTLDCFAALAMTSSVMTTAACAGPKPQAGFEAALPAPPAAAPRQADGSIFNAQGGYAALHTGHRARAVGDPLTIVLVENTSTTKSASSKTARSGSFGLTPPATGPLSFIKPDSVSASGQTAFKGDGSANQTSALSGEVSVTIAEVRANGTALVRGQKRLMLSQGEEWVQVSGIVRLADLDANNRIASTQVADARIAYAGNGPVSRASREGWLSRFFNAISPF